MARLTRTQIREENEGLKNKINDLEASLNTKDEQHKADLELKATEYAAEKQNLQNSISELEKQNEEKQSQLNSRELKKLATAYKEQEDIYGTDAEKWFKYTLVSFAVLIVSIGSAVIWPSEDLIVNGKVLVINFVLVTFLVFSLKQYSYFVKLKTDYANRKTLAQSYQNIINSADDEDLKPIFLDKAANVLCSKNDVKHESYTLPEKIIESLAEVTKTLSKKV